MEAILHFDVTFNAWVAAGDRTTIVYAPGSCGD
jgi:hypothetical protein